MPHRARGRQAWIRPIRNGTMAAAASAHRFPAGSRRNDLPGNLPRMRHSPARRTEARRQRSLPLPAPETCPRAGITGSREVRYPSAKLCGVAGFPRCILPQPRTSKVRTAQVCLGHRAMDRHHVPKHSCRRPRDHWLEGDLALNEHGVPDRHRASAISRTSDRNRNRRRRPQAGSVPQA